MAAISNLRLSGARASAPWLTVKLILPTTAASPWLASVRLVPVTALINVNTATGELVRTLTENMTASGAEELQRNRPADGYDSVDSFLNETAFNGLDASAKDALKPLLTVHDRWQSLDRESAVGSALDRAEKFLLLAGLLGIVLAALQGVIFADYQLANLGKDIFKGFGSMQEIFLLSMSKEGTKDFLV